MIPLVSIIIPTYNRAQLIGETLDSVLEQTYINWECIVVDDGSTDNTEVLLNEYCEKDSRFQYHQRPNSRSKGVNSCRNYGFELSKGAYINWFDDDDLYKPKALNCWLSHFDKKTDVVVTKLEKIDSETHRVISENTILSNTLIKDYIIGKVSFYVCGPLWKRTFLENQDLLFDDTISNLDDWDFNLRMLYQKPEIKYIDEPLIYYRIHNASLSKEIDKFNINEIKSEFKAREKHVKLIKKNKKVDSIVLRKFIIERYHYFLRESLVNNSNYKWCFFIMLLKKQVGLKDYRGLLKSCFGFVSFSLFKKGYKFIK
jgi:glycosyltransferase involved in cell wall biosynthesis